MANLTPVRRRIAQMVEVTSGYEGPLPETDGIPSDSSMLIMAIAAPPQRYEPGETLSIWVNNEIGFSWPVADIVARYEALGVGNPALADVHECIRLITQKMAIRLRDATEEPVDYASVIALKGLLEAFGKAAAEASCSPGIKLGRAIMVPPRAVISVRTSSGSKLRVHLAGLRSIEV